MEKMIGYYGGKAGLVELRYKARYEKITEQNARVVV